MFRDTKNSLEYSPVLNKYSNEKKFCLFGGCSLFLSIIFSFFFFFFLLFSSFFLLHSFLLFHFVCVLLCWPVGLLVWSFLLFCFCLSFFSLLKLCIMELETLLYQK